MLKINYYNQYDDQKCYKDIIKKVLKTGYKFLQINDTVVINIILVNDNEIQKLNKMYRDIDRVTDVLSFENLEEEDELGDVFISIDKAHVQAQEYGHSFERELAFLACHGFLHCNGYDHHTIEEEKEMFSIQEKILELASYKR